jgi:hypothetical protein
MQILSSTTMLRVCVYSIFLFTTICPQQELVSLIVDVVPPSAQGKLKFFEGVHKLLLPPETSPKACSNYYPWFLKRPSNKTSKYTNNGFYFFLVRFCYVYIKDTWRSIRFQLCFITSNANPQDLQKEDVTDGELHCWIQDFVIRGLNPFAHKTWPTDPPCHTDTYHTIFGLKFKYNYAYYRCKVPPALKD